MRVSFQCAIALPTISALLAGCSGTRGTPAWQPPSAVFPGASMHDARVGHRIAASPLSQILSGVRPNGTSCPASAGESGTRDVPASAGTLFESNFGGKTPEVQEFDDSGTNQTPLGTLGYAFGSGHNPEGLSVDASGDLFVTDYSGNIVLEFPQGSSAPSNSWNVDDGVLYPLKAVADSSGDVYVVNDRGGPILIFPPGKTHSTQLTGFMYPTDVAFDGSGNMYVVDHVWGNNPPLGAVFKFAPGSQTGTNMNLTGLDYPVGIAFGAANNFFVTNLGNNTVTEYTAKSTAPKKTITKNVCAPLYDTVTPAGVLFVANNAGKPNGNVTGYKGKKGAWFVTLTTNMANVRGVADNPNWQP